MFVVLIRAPDFRPTPWVQEELPYLPWLDEAGWQPPRPWETPQRGMLLGVPDELPVGLDEPSWQPPRPWVIGPVLGLGLLGTADELPLGLDEPEWPLPRPWLAVQAPWLAQGTDEWPRLLWVDEDPWQSPRPWVVADGRLYWHEGLEELQLLGLEDADAWQAPVLWAAWAVGGWSVRTLPPWGPGEDQADVGFGDGTRRYEWRGAYNIWHRSATL